MTSSSTGPSGMDGWGILADLWQFIHSVTDDSAPALEAIGMSPKALFLLGTVEEHPFPGELARLMHLPPPTVSYLVKQMEARGFLSRQAEPGDLRKFRLVITDDGHEAIGKAREAVGSSAAMLMAKLDPEQLGQLERLLKKLVG